MLLSVGLHVLFSILLIQFGGAVGLVTADGLNMLIRIAFSFWSVVLPVNLEMWCFQVYETAFQIQ